MSKVKFTPSAKLSQNLRIIYAINKDFRRDIEHIRKNIPIIKLYIPEIQEKGEKGIKHDIKDFKELEELINNYELVVSNLRIKYRLSPTYQEPIKELIEHDFEIISASSGLLHDLWPFVIANPENPNEKIVVIKISPETTINDLQRHWPEIKKDVSRLLNAKQFKISKKENLDRDLKIFELKQAGKTGKEIASVINRQYPNQLIGYQDIAKIIKRLKDSAKKLLGQAR